MFDYFPEPWKGTNIPVMVTILDIKTGSYLTTFPGYLVHESLRFSSKSLDYKLVNTQVNGAKSFNSIRFPLNFIKFFRVEELFDHQDVPCPRLYRIVFHVDLTSTENGIKVKDNIV